MKKWESASNHLISTSLKQEAHHLQMTWKAAKG
jgi:hypothetical protein